MKLVRNQDVLTAVCCVAPESERLLNETFAEVGFEFAFTDRGGRLVFDTAEGTTYRVEVGGYIAAGSMDSLIVISASDIGTGYGKYTVIK